MDSSLMYTAPSRFLFSPRSVNLRSDLADPALRNDYRSPVIQLPSLRGLVPSSSRRSSSPRRVVSSRLPFFKTLIPAKPARRFTTRTALEIFLWFIIIGSTKNVSTMKNVKFFFFSSKISTTVKLFFPFTDQRLWCIIYTCSV